MNSSLESDNVAASLTQVVSNSGTTQLVEKLQDLAVTGEKEEEAAIVNKSESDSKTTSPGMCQSVLHDLCTVCVCVDSYLGYMAFVSYIFFLLCALLQICYNFCCILVHLPYHCES